MVLERHVFRAGDGEGIEIGFVRDGVVFRSAPGGPVITEIFLLPDREQGSYYRVRVALFVKVLALQAVKGEAGDDQAAGRKEAGQRIS